MKLFKILFAALIAYVPTAWSAVEKKAERFGTLFAAGLIVGESLMGVILAFIIAASVTSGGSEAPLALELENWDNIGELLGLAVFIFGIFVFISRVLRAKRSK